MPSNRGAGGHSDRSERSILNPEKIHRDIVVIGASAGGVMALMELFAAFPPSLPGVVGVVLHRGPEKGHLAHVLGRRSALPLMEPDGKAAMKRAHIYLAPPDHHLLFEKSGIMIQRGPKEHSTRPAIDPLFRSAAVSYGRRVVGVLLTGAGEDGVSGLIAISQTFGVTLAQDPGEAYMPSMPLNALRADDVNGVFTIKEMASVIAALVRGEQVISQSEFARVRYG